MFYSRISTIKILLPVREKQKSMLYPLGGG